MDGMHGGHMPDMSAPPPGMTMNGTGMHRHKMMMMHMTFFWGKNTEILFTGWPGTSSGMYALALVFVFFLAFFVEWLSHCNLIKDGSNRVAAGLFQTLMHAVRVGLAYMVMLSVMSFNVGVFLAAVAGHSLGFMLFGSKLFKKSPPSATVKSRGLPPMNC